MIGMLEPETIVNIDYKPWTVTMSGQTYATVVHGNVMRIIRVKDYV